MSTSCTFSEPFGVESLEALKYLTCRLSRRHDDEEFLPALLWISDQIQHRAHLAKDLADGGRRLTQDADDFRVLEEIRQEATPIGITKGKMRLQELDDRR